MSKRTILSLGMAVFLLPVVLSADDSAKASAEQELLTSPNQSNDIELRRLLKERFEAAKGIMVARMAYYRGGRTIPDDVLASIERFVQAGLEYSETRHQQIEICESALKAAKQIEQDIRMKFENNIEPVQTMERAKYTCFDVEIKLYLLRKLANDADSKK